VRSDIVQQYNFRFLLRTVHQIMSTKYIIFNRSGTDNTIYATARIKLCKNPWIQRSLLILQFQHSITIVNPTRCSNFSSLFYFWDNTLHVSDGLSIHHEDFKTVHTATGICTVLNSWWWMERPSETCRVLSQKWNKFKKLLHLVGFTVEIYCDAWSYEHQIANTVLLHLTWFRPLNH
jgi:hypothetical protein